MGVVDAAVSRNHARELDQLLGGGIGSGRIVETRRQPKGPRLHLRLEQSCLRRVDSGVEGASRQPSAAIRSDVLPTNEATFG